MWELAARSLQSPNSMRRSEEVFGGDCVCGGGWGEAGTGKGKGRIGKKWTGMKEAEGDKSNAAHNSIPTLINSI